MKKLWVKGNSAYYPSEDTLRNFVYNEVGNFTVYTKKYTR
jgi:hypothetical protein